MKTLNQLMNLSAKNLIDGGRFFECALVYDFLSHFFHEEHESVERFLDDGSAR